MGMCQPSRLAEDPNDFLDTTDPKRNKEGFRLPKSLNFVDLKEKHDESGVREQVEEYMAEQMKSAGLPITDPSVKEFDGGKFETLKTDKLSIGLDKFIEVIHEKIAVRGSKKSVPAMRHVIKFSGCSIEVGMDVWSRVAYTKDMDDFLQKVASVENYDFSNETYKKWGHVCCVYEEIFTPMFAPRFFVFYDLFDEEHRMFFAKTCKHPEFPTPPQPGCRPACAQADGYGHQVVMYYVARFIPDPQDSQSWTLVIVEYDEMGGNLKVNEKTLTQFSTQFVQRFFSVLTRVLEQKLDVGPGSKGYIEDQLKDGFKPWAKDMIPDLK